MKLALSLPSDIAIALRRMALEGDRHLAAAAEMALRDWLIGNGYLELDHELDEETETLGSA